MKDYKSDLYLTLTIKSIGVVGFPRYEYTFTDVITDATVFVTLNDSIVDEYLDGDTERWEIVTVNW